MQEVTSLLQGVTSSYLIIELLCLNGVLYTSENIIFLVGKDESRSVS